MKILFWSYSFWPCLGGIHTQGLALVKELQNRGHHCIVIARQNSESWPVYEEHQSIPIYRYPFDQAYIRNDLKSMHGIFKHIKNLMTQFNPDVVHLNIGFGVHLLTYNMISKVTSIPSLVTVHGFDQAQPACSYKKSLGIGDWLTCVSNSTLEEARQYKPEITGTSSCIYNGLPVPSIQPNTLSFKPARILCLGRLIKDKGFDLAIQAVHLLLKRMDHIELIIAGDGEEHTNLKILTQNLGLEKVVTFSGKVEQTNVLKLINTSTIVLVPSRYEPFGLVALEAMQMARPVIAARSGGLNEIIRDQKTGLFVANENIDELTNAMEYLLHHPDLATEMGQKARDDVLNRFSVDKMVTAYEQAYLKVIQLKKAKEQQYEQAIN